jgi:hypothetical protein
VPHLLWQELLLLLPAQYGNAAKEQFPAVNCPIPAWELFWAVDGRG